MKEPPLPPDERLRLDYVVNDSSNFSESPFTFIDFDGGDATYTQDIPELPYFSEFNAGLQARQNEHDDATANGATYPIPTFGSDATGTIAHGPRSPNLPPGFAPQIHTPNIRGATNGEELSQVESQHLDLGRSTAHSSLAPQLPYDSPRATSPSIYSPPPMPPGSYPATNSLPQHRVAITTSRYTSFSGAFNTAESATAYRKAATRFGRKPYRPPSGDGTISLIANDRPGNVKRIYDAMTRSDAAKDNSGSIAMKRWVHEAFYPSALVESFAHKVFDCLLEQAKDGFRGWQHNDYATDDRKGEPEDRNFSCAERLDSIVIGLEEEKTICEDVMSSACQIRMFVNAPRAYARRKEANRNGNSKRGRSNAVTAAKPTPSRVTKTRKLATRPTTRLQQALSSSPSPRSAPDSLRTADLHLSPLSQPPQLPYYHAQPPLQHSPSPLSNQNPPRPGPYPIQPHNLGFLSDEFAPQRMTFSPPTNPHANLPRFNALPPHQQSPYLSPPQMSIPHDSSSVTPDGQYANGDGLFSTVTWLQADTVSGAPCTQPEDQFDFTDWTLAPITNNATGDFHSSTRTHIHGLPVQNSVDPNELHLDPSFRTYFDQQCGAQSISQSPREKGEHKT